VKRSFPGAAPARAQDTRDHSGTIVWLNADGSVPADNPLAGNSADAPVIYTYGHRNIQGIVRHPATGEIWVTVGYRARAPRQRRAQPDPARPQLRLARHEPGPRIPHSGAVRRVARRDERFARPAFEFLPTLAPSGLAVVQGERYHPTLQGNLLAGGLRAQRILRLVIEDQEVVHAEELLHGVVGRIRDVRQGPDGYIYVLSDENDGGLYRIEPAG
jgi:aldose sugar dehydrogenase